MNPVRPPSDDCSEGRGIPEGIRRQLRTEVNFGCPVPGCGNPYLSYHHFDPPYHAGKSHDAAGMIALCLPHHRQADVGTWPHDRLRTMKRAPYLAGEEVRGRLEWLRRDVMIQAGSNLALNPGALLKVGGQNVIWTRRDPGGLLCLNVHILGTDGKDLLRIEDNDWIVTGRVSDLRASASAHSIRVQAPDRGVTLNIRFSDLTEASVRDVCEAQAQARAGQPQLPPDLMAGLPEDLAAALTPTADQIFEELWSPYATSGIRWPAMLVELSGRFSYPVPIRLTPKKVELPRGCIMSGNLFMVPGVTLVSVSP